MDPTGESVRRLSDFGFDPCFSPDGREVVVGTVGSQLPTDRSGRGELWAIEIATGQKRQIARPADAIQPRVSPHGTRIAYWGLRADGGQRDVWTVAADGSELDPAAGAPRKIVDVSGYFIRRSLGVTADDRWITYTETATDGDIWLMTLE